MVSESSELLRVKSGRERKNLSQLSPFLPCTLTRADSLDTIRVNLYATKH